MRKKAIQLVGGHMSIAGGFEKSIDRGEETGCTAIQIFTKSNRQWAAKNITADDAALFKQRKKESTISLVVAHASYLINLASAEPATRHKSIKALRDELVRCDILDIPYLVLHPGSGGHQENSVGLKYIIAGLEEAFDGLETSTMVLLETMAGQGSSCCATLEDLAYILNHLSKKVAHHIGVCVDTCHIFAAGYDIRDAHGYDQFWKAFDKLIGIDNVKAIHCNDSKKELGSHVDRHEHIGKGQIGLECFTLLMNDTRFAHVPKIAETPKGETSELEDDRRNIATLKAAAKE